VLAATEGREDVLPDDVRKLVAPVMSHRIILSPDAVLRDETVGNVVERVLARVKVPMGLKASP
jgi:MoxR-like ATPase